MKTEAIRRIHTKCLKALLRPVLRYCLKRSFTIQDLIAVAKSSIVEIAAESIEEENAAVNYSRLSIMTGIHRQEVKRLYQWPQENDTSTSYIRKILGQWEQDPRFQDAVGNPKRLECQGDDSDFRKLVRSVTVDVNPSTVLFELERIDAVERNSHEIELKRSDQLIADDPEEVLHLLSRDTEDLTIAIEENIVGGHDVRNLHGRTMYDNIYLEDLKHVKEWLLEEGSEFHRRARRYLARFDKDINGDPDRLGGGKVIVGNYSRVKTGKIA